jgi:hypothetical protein
LLPHPNVNKFLEYYVIPPRDYNKWKTEE